MSLDLPCPIPPSFQCCKHPFRSLGLIQPAHTWKPNLVGKKGHFWRNNLDLSCDESRISPQTTSPARSVVGFMEPTVEHADPTPGFLLYWHTWRHNCEKIPFIYTERNLLLLKLWNFILPFYSLFYCWLSVKFNWVVAISCSLCVLSDDKC